MHSYSDFHLICIAPLLGISSLSEADDLENTVVDKEDVSIHDATTSSSTFTNGPSARQGISLIPRFFTLHIGRLLSS